MTENDDVFAGLSGPYSTLVVDPPWTYEQGFNDWSYWRFPRD